MNILFLLLAIALFIALVLKNVPIVIATILSSIFLLLTQQMDLYDGITATYMTGFGDYVRDFFLLFMLGALFGKLVEISGAANSISTFIFRAFGDRFAIIGLIIMGITLCGAVPPRTITILTMKRTPTATARWSSTTTTVLNSPA